MMEKLTEEVTETDLLVPNIMVDDLLHIYETAALQTLV